ncbi:MAG TPA: hypothetical protein G4O01_03030 [Dehalococcoidia bacterium]|nr:hypothetical protein [Dehalococcoidia bacterium]
MAEQLGKIERPQASDFRNKRKLYLVPLLFSGEKAPAEYKEKFALYWAQVGEHVANLEAKIGKVSHIYHESIALGGEDGLKVLERLNPSSYRIAREKCQGGAVLEATEDRELADENMDWERFLLMGFLSQKVAKVVAEFYEETSRKRYEHIARRIDETLKTDEAGILFIREGHLVQFPRDIEVFSVAPPALDEIHRWQRQRLAAEEEGEGEDERH